MPTTLWQQINCKQNKKSGRKIPKTSNFWLHICVTGFWVLAFDLSSDLMLEFSFSRAIQNCYLSNTARTWYRTCGDVRSQLLLTEVPQQVPINSLNGACLALSRFFLGLRPLITLHGSACCLSSYFDKFFGSRKKYIFLVLVIFWFLSTLFKHTFEMLGSQQFARGAAPMAYGPLNLCRRDPK